MWAHRMADEQINFLQLSLNIALHSLWYSFINFYYERWTCLQNKHSCPQQIDAQMTH